MRNDGAQVAFCGSIVAVISTTWISQSLNLFHQSRSTKRSVASIDYLQLYFLHQTFNQSLNLSTEPSANEEAVND